MVLYGEATGVRAARAAAAARRGLIDPPDRLNFPLHAERGLEPVLGDEAVVLGYRIGPLPTEPLPADRYTEVLASLPAGPRQPVTWQDLHATVGDLINALHALDDAATARRVFASTEYRELLGKSDAAMASAESRLGHTSPSTDYVEPRGLRAKWLALRARVVDGWGKVFFARRSRPESLMAFEPNSLRAAELARRAGRFELRDRILANHRLTIRDNILEPEAADTYFAEHHLGEREMQRALRSGLVLVDADHVDALGSFHAAATFVAMSMKDMQSKLTAVDPTAPRDTPDTSALDLPPKLVTSFELNGAFNPLWQAPELSADARVSYATGRLRLHGLSDGRVRRELAAAGNVLASAVEANDLAQRVIRAHLAARRANGLYRSSTWVPPDAAIGADFAMGVGAQGYHRDVTANVQAWLDADLVPAATRLATKQRVVAALVTGGTTLASLATQIGPD